MTAPVAQAQLGFIAPCLIVRDVVPSIAFYRDRLGFGVMFLGSDDDPFEVMDADGYVLYFGRPV